MELRARLQQEVAAHTKISIEANSISSILLDVEHISLFKMDLFEMD